MTLLLVVGSADAPLIPGKLYNECWESLLFNRQCDILNHIPG